MKPFVVHQSVPPPQDHEAELSENGPEAVCPPDAAHDGRDLTFESTPGHAPGLVGNFGPLVDIPQANPDGSSDEERSEP